MLKVPRLRLLHTLDTDASEHHIECTPRQTRETNNPYQVGYWFRTLIDAEHNYLTSKK